MTMLLNTAISRFLKHLKGLGRSDETLRGYRTVLNYLERYFTDKLNGPVYLDDITFHDLDDFIYTMGTERGWNPNSVKKCHYTLRSFFSYCHRKELIAKDISGNMEPVTGIRKERTYLTWDEIHQLIDAIDHQVIKTIVTTMSFTGMRISECLNLTLDDIDLEKKVVHVKNTKSKVDRSVPLHESLIPILAEYRDMIRPPDLTTDRFFALKKSGAVSIVYVNQTLAEACKNLGWKTKITSHILRHSFASNLVNKNVSLVHIQKLLGHADLRTTSVYTHARLDELTDTINLL